MNDTPAQGRFARATSWLRQERAARLFVWAVWLAALGVALCYVQRFALRLPVCDDWTQYVGPLTGRKTFDWDRLWHQNNEHRLPLVHLILYPLAVLTNGVFRVENYLNVLVLGGLAAILIVTAQRLRGVQRHSDAFFPLALLNLGHFDVFLSRLMFNHVLSAVLASLVLVLLCLQREPLSLRRSCLLGVLLLCLPLCGANGLPLVVLSAGWLIVAARSGGGKPANGWGRLRACHFAVAGAALVLVGLYFVGFTFPKHHTPPPDVHSVVRTFVQCLSTSYLHWSPAHWPWSGLVVPLLIAATAVLAVWKWWKQPLERTRSFALLLFLAAVLATAGGIAWGRAWIGPNAGVASRYAVIIVPSLLCVYLTWVIYAPPAVGRWMERGLFTLFCVTLFINTRDALHVGHWIRKQEEAIVRAMQEGAPPFALAQRGAGVFHSPDLNRFIEKRMVDLRDAGVRPFQALHDRPTWLKTPIELSACEPHDMTWDGKQGELTGAHPQLVIHLPEAQFVHAVRIRCRLTPVPTIHHWIEFAWRERGVTEFSGRRQSARYLVATGAEENNVLVWVNASLDELRLAPDAASCRIEIREITLLRKDEAAALASNAQ